MSDLLAVGSILFVAAAFAASFVGGLAGFAFWKSVWLHFLPPAQTPADCKIRFRRYLADLARV